MDTIVLLVIVLGIMSVLLSAVPLFLKYRQSKLTLPEFLTTRQVTRSEDSSVIAMSDKTEEYISPEPLGIAWLVEPSVGRSFPLPAWMRIGRDGSNDIVLSDKRVSRKHAEIRYSDDGQFVITDLHSVSGTRVNGELITAQTLADGDLIQIGDQRFVFKRV